MKLKYAIQLNDIQHLSTTSQNDTFVVLHVNVDKEKKETSKGDHMFYCDGIIEFITKLDLAYRKHCHGHRLNISIADSFELHINRKGPTTVAIERGEEEEEEVRIYIF